MKKLLFLFFLLHTLNSNCQKVLLDENKTPTINLSAAKFYKTIEYGSNSTTYKELYFYITGEKESEVSYIKSLKKYVEDGKAATWYKSGQMKSDDNYILGKKQGKAFTWYENGQLKSDIDYVDDKHNGSVVTFWENGKIKRKDSFIKNQFENGTCYDSLGNVIKHFDYEIMPMYPGGEKQLLKDIGDNTIYPARSKNSGIQGRVIVKFAVNESGNLSNIEIIEGINQELNDEAIRVVRTLKKFKPGYCDGVPVKIYYMIPITFILR